MPVNLDALKAAMSTRLTVPLTPGPASTQPDRASSAPPSPERNPGKRLRRIDDSDDEDGISPPAADGIPHATQLFASTNDRAFAGQQCKKAKFDSAETADVDAFAQLSDRRQRIVIYTKLMKVEKSQAKIVVETNKWDGISTELRENINKYAHVVLIAPDLHSYRGAVPVNHLLSILKTHRFGLPPKIEFNKAHWAVITETVGNAITQRRRAFKKDVQESKDINVYRLAEKLIGTSGCTLSLEFVARTAIMRAVYHEEGMVDTKFWLKVDGMLDKIREEAKDDAVAASSALKWFIDEDVKKYGDPNEDSEIPDYDGEAPDWQKEANDIVKNGPKRRD